MTEKSSNFMKILQTILLTLVLLAFVVDRLIMPRVGAERAVETLAQTNVRLTEGIANEKRIATLESNYANIKELLADISRKLDQHIEKSK